MPGFWVHMYPQPTHNRRPINTHWGRNIILQKSNQIADSSTQLGATGRRQWCLIASTAAVIIEIIMIVTSRWAALLLGREYLQWQEDHLFYPKHLSKQVRAVLEIFREMQQNTPGKVFLLFLALPRDPGECPGRWRTSSCRVPRSNRWPPSTPNTLQR